MLILLSHRRSRSLEVCRALTASACRFLSGQSLAFVVERCVLTQDLPKRALSLALSLPPELMTVAFLLLARRGCGRATWQDGFFSCRTCRAYDSRNATIFRIHLRRCLAIDAESTEDDEDEDDSDDGSMAARLEEGPPEAGRRGRGGVNDDESGSSTEDVPLKSLLERDTVLQEQTYRTSPAAVLEHLFSPSRSVSPRSAGRPRSDVREEASVQIGEESSVEVVAKGLGKFPSCRSSVNLLLTFDLPVGRRVGPSRPSARRHAGQSESIGADPLCVLSPCRTASSLADFAAATRTRTPFSSASTSSRVSVAAWATLTTRPRRPSLSCR